MQRTTIILACFVICVNSFTQQYPFVHYTPKDGLISNQIRTIYQDSKGRLYFTSVNGLSIYDGSRFINYTSRNGLDHDIVNCVMEMGDDSIWIVTNNSTINCLVKGKIKKLDLKGTPIIIDKLIKDKNNLLYAASEQGLYKFHQNEFIKLPFLDKNGNDKSRFTSFIWSHGDHLLVQREYSLLPGEKPLLYLYSKRTEKIVDEIEKINTLDTAPDGRVWVCTEKNIMALDTAALSKGKLVLQELPSAYEKIKNLRNYFIDFDEGNNCWLGDQSQKLFKIEPGGHMTTFSTASGLSMSFINAIFLDKENITWIATNNAGLNKLVQSNFSLTEKPSGIKDLSYYNDKNHLLLYSSKDSKLAILKNDTSIALLKLSNASDVEKIVATPYGFFGSSLTRVYRLAQKGNTLYPEIILKDSGDHVFGGLLVDKNGNFIICGKEDITAIVKGTTICKRKLNFFADQSVIDSKGNIWVVTRASELTMFSPNINDPVNYLEQKKVFSKELSGFSPRSIIIDMDDNIWIGTRGHGINVFAVNNGILVKKFFITTASGLSDNFTTHLACDANNSIWACSALGLDKISIKDGIPVIENITKQNNIYQSVFKVVIDKNNTAWGSVSNGLIKITAEIKQIINYSPTLMVSMVKAGKDTIFDKSTFSYKQNNFIFNFSATSFSDEKQILYSYRLLGGSNTHWSEPSNNSSVSFIDLPPGNYSLDIKARFPAGRYPEQIINYKFSISPAWWQTWWFRSAVGLLIIGLSVIAVRFYYRRKLEKQQAIEKERTRIATDMHDDLGAGLSRIKFLSESIRSKKGNDDTIQKDIEKISTYSDEMAEKMGEIVWALNEKNDTVADLIAFTRSYVVEYLSSHNIEYEIDSPLNLPTTFITGEMRQNIFLSVKECLYNIVKHAEATKVHFIVKLDKRIGIVIQDNGKGINFHMIRPFSNGLQNIESRMKEIRGKAEFTNHEGTRVSLSVPLNI